MVWRWPYKATEEWRWRLRDNARKIGKSGESWYICNWMSFTRPFLLCTVFFRTALPCSGGYHMEKGGMPLHDVVGINCKKWRNYWKSRLRCQVYRLRGVSWWLCVCFIWLNTTAPPWCREKVKVYYYVLKFWSFWLLFFVVNENSTLVENSMKSVKFLNFNLIKKVRTKTAIRFIW